MTAFLGERARPSPAGRFERPLLARQDRILGVTFTHALPLAESFPGARAGRPPSSPEVSENP